MARRFCMHSPATNRIRILNIPGMNWDMGIMLIRRQSNTDLDDIIDTVGKIVVEAGAMSDTLPDNNAQMLSA